jgi:hypothetical protein
LTPKMIRRINKEAKRRKHGLSKIKTFQETTCSLRELRETKRLTIVNRGK